MIEKHCTGCHTNDLEELVWVNQISGHITDREDQYYCNHCKTKVSVVVAESASCRWVEDITPLEESNLTPEE